jgi:hypothetical protein
MASVIPDPVKLPVGMRAWCIRDTQKSRGKFNRAKSTSPNPMQPAAEDAAVTVGQLAERPSRFIAIRTEIVTAATASLPGVEAGRWTREIQPLLIGCAVIGRTQGFRVEREVIFYPDDLPETGIAALRAYIEDRTYRLGARPRREGDAEPHLIWRDQRQVGVQLLRLSQFLKLLYRIACEDKALIVGFDLAAQLSRFAFNWREVKKGKHVGAWHLDLWSYRDGKTGEQRPSAGWRPYVILHRKAPDVVFIEFDGRRPDKNAPKAPPYRGEFLDPANLLNALTGRHWKFADALATFTGKVLAENAEPGALTAGDIDHCRKTLRATVSLTNRLIELFDRLHPVSRGAGGHLSEMRLYSPGGLARAYLKAAGFVPPTVPKDRIGACTAAFVGGWAEVQVRGRVPIVHVDFRREYQTVFLLQGLQDLLAAKRLAFIDDTDAIRRFVERVTIEDLLRPETWPLLNAICWLKPNGETMVGRWAFEERTADGDPDRFSVAITPRYGDQPIPAYLAHVVAAKLLTGRAPEIIRAERIVPKGRQTLRATTLIGGMEFDPHKEQFFKVLVEEGERFNRGKGQYAAIPDDIRAAILPGIKGIGNNGCFGVPIEARQADLLAGRREEVTLLSDDEPIRAAVAHPEDPGPFACPPLAGLVAAGGQLLLAMVHRLVADRGGIIACDTDGAHIIATETGGTVYVETRGADFHDGGRAQPVHALSWAEVDEIVARFEPLNPFDRALLPGSPLRVQSVNFDD